MNKTGYYEEKEIRTSVNLCDSKGNLNKDAIGWSRNPVHNLNLKGHTFRKKRWNYWYIINDEMLFSATISDVDYAGPVFVYFYDFNTGKFIEKTIFNPLAIGVKVPKGLRESINYKNKEMNVDFIEDGDITKIDVSSNNFGQEKIDAQLNIKHLKDYETMNVIIPWSEKIFQYTSKQNCMPTSGKIIIGEKTYELNENDTFAGLDFGRGVWPKNVFWNWATFSGKAGGNTIGINLGGTWTDNTGMCENAVIVNGKVNKIHENIEFVYNASDIMKPWVIKTQMSNKVKLTFTPLYERLAKANIIGIIKSDVHQMIGSFTGYITDEDGNRYGVSSIKGCAEEHTAKW